MDGLRFMYVCTYVSMYVSTYVYMCTCLCVCICIYIIYIYKGFVFFGLAVWGAGLRIALNLPLKLEGFMGFRAYRVLGFVCSGFSEGYAAFSEVIYEGILGLRT